MSRADILESEVTELDDVLDLASIWVQERAAAKI